MKTNMKWEEFTHHIDRLIHDYGNSIIPTAVFFAALIFLGIGYLATHRFSVGEKQDVSQEVRQ